MTQLSVGRAKAVDVLITKNLDLLDQFDSSMATRRLRHAINRAQKRYERVRDRDSHAFYHGLITGRALLDAGTVPADPRSDALVTLGG